MEFYVCSWKATDKACFLQWIISSSFLWESLSKINDEWNLLHSFSFSFFPVIDLSLFLFFFTSQTLHFYLVPAMLVYVLIKLISLVNSFSKDIEKQRADNLLSALSNLEISKNVM